MAEATIDVDGRPVRAHEAATTVPEAVDLLVDRLRRRIKRHEERRHQLPERRRARDADSWHHGDPPTVRPEYLDVPFDERDVRRHKTLAMEPMRIEEAVFDLDLLGHSFYLFVDEASGADAVVSWDGDHIALQGSGELPASEIEQQRLDGVVVSASAPPVLDPLDAKEHLEASGDDWLFHVAPGSRRGQVLYRRYDGHYGLVIAT